MLTVTFGHVRDGIGTVRPPDSRSAGLAPRLWMARVRCNAGVEETRSGLRALDLAEYAPKPTAGGVYRLHLCSSEPLLSAVARSFTKRLLSQLSNTGGKFDRLTPALLVRCRMDRIEPPGRTDRIVTAAQTWAGKLRCAYRRRMGSPPRARAPGTGQSVWRGWEDHAMPPGSHGESLPAAHAGCYLVSPSLPAGACLMPNSGLAASAILSANFR